MSSRTTVAPSASSELLDFSLPVTAEDSRALDALRYAHPLPFLEYLAFATRWSDAWVRQHGQRGPDEHFDRPFEL
ncbi:MAG: hypothetical protein ABIU84_12310 [Thermoanaerobaculia bacterium]